MLAEERVRLTGFAEWFDVGEAGIIVADGRDVGWLQTREDEREIFLGSADVLPDMQRHEDRYKFYMRLDSSE